MQFSAESTEELPLRQWLEILLGEDAKRQIRLRQMTNEELFLNYDADLVSHHQSDKALDEERRVISHFKDSPGEWPPSPEAAIATDLDVYTRRLLLERLTGNYDGMSIIYNAELKEIDGRHVIYWQRGREKSLRGLDMIVLALALVANKELYNGLKSAAEELGAEIYAVGDCRKPRRAVQAVEDAFLLARQL